MHTEGDVYCVGRYIMETKEMELVKYIFPFTFVH